jgi:hypothetical protein
MNRFYLTVTTTRHWQARIVLCCLVVFSQGACGRDFKPLPSSEPQPAASAAMSNITVNPQEVVTTLLKQARSADPAEQQQLVKALNSTATLDQVDAKQERMRLPAAKLRLSGVFQALMENPSAPAKQTLVALTQATSFKDCPACEELLIKALATVRPPSPEVIRYWDVHSTPDAIHTYFVIDALCQNGSAAAIALLEKKLLDPQHDHDMKVTWLRTSVLRHRYDVPLLQAAWRMLSATLPKSLRATLVEALFDYRREWFPPDANASAPPDAATASPAAIKLLQQIGKFALARVTLTKTQKSAVTKLVVDK